MISMVNVLGWQRPHTNLQHPQNIYVHDKTRRCKQLQMEQETQKHERDTRKETSDQDFARKFPENKGDVGTEEMTLRAQSRPLPNFP